MKQLLLILKLKRAVCKRFFLQAPFPYVFLLSVMALLLGYVLFKIDIPVSRQSIAGAVIIQFFLCGRIKYPVNKRLFLKQYRRMYPISVFIDSVLFSIPFVLVNVYLWMMAVVVAFLYSAFGLNERLSIKFRPVLPSPFFMKSSYLWHAQQRYLLPVIWILIVIFIVIAYLHDNYNLGLVALGGGSFIGFVTTILATEDVDFVHIYINRKHFVKKTLSETLYNAALYLFPLVIALFLFFPGERKITLLFFPSVLLIIVQLLWTKYAFYPSSLLAAVVFFLGLLLQGIMSVTLYGIFFVPVYTGVLYFLCNKNIRAIIRVSEKRL